MIELNLQMFGGRGGGSGAGAGGGAGGGAGKGSAGGGSGHHGSAGSSGLGFVTKFEKGQSYAVYKLGRDESGKVVAKLFDEFDDPDDVKEIVGSKHDKQGVFKKGGKSYVVRRKKK